MLVLKDEASFWRHCDATRRPGRTTADFAEAEERLDLRVAETIKALLEREVGPEEGPNPVQTQNWDWNDDRRRGVYMLRSVFRPDLIPKLQSLLVRDFSNFEIILMLHDSLEGEAWGHIKLAADHIALQRNVAEAYAIAA